jgi:hypothetical protein
MKNKIAALTYFLIITISNSELLAQKNLIQNPGFEEPYCDTCYPQNMGHVYIHKSGDLKKDVAYIKSWTGRAHFGKKGTFNQDLIYHSPDWYYKGFYGGIARTGTGCIGMSNYELIQQKFNEKMQAGKLFLITLYIQNDAGAYAAWGPQNYSLLDSELNVTISKNEIQYQKEDNITDEVNCNTKYISHQDGPSQDIKTIASFDLNQTDYPIVNKKWYKLQKFILAPENISRYDWFNIEIRRKNYDPIKGYSRDCDWDAKIYIDDVSIIPFCDYPCAPALGDISIDVQPTVTSNTPAVISISNIIGYDIKIYGTNPKKPKQKHLVFEEKQTDINGLNHYLDPNKKIFNFYWFGHSQNGEFDNINTYYIYNYELNTWNCSQEKKFEGNINIVSKPPKTTPYEKVWENFNFNYDDCCIESHTIKQRPRKHSKFIASDFISAGEFCNLQSDFHTIFQAGNEIELLPNFSIEPGANFTAYIEDCVVNPLYNIRIDDDPILAANDFSIEESIIEQDTLNLNIPMSVHEILEAKYRIYPNPNSGNFKVELLGENAKGIVSILDHTGRLILQKSINKESIVWIDLSPFSPGIYFVKISDGETVKIEKVVYQR